MSKWLRKLMSFLLTKWCGKDIDCRKGAPKIHGFCRLGKNLSIGLNGNFNGATIYGCGKVTIGDNFHSGKGLVILTQNHNYMGTALPYDNSVVIRNVVIGDNVWLGMNVTLLPGVEIGEGVIVQAGSVVSSNISALEIVGGNPARLIKSRDAAHYSKLKANGDFH